MPQNSGFPKSSKNWESGLSTKILDYTLMISQNDPPKCWESGWFGHGSPDRRHPRLQVFVRLAALIDLPRTDAQLRRSKG